MIKRLLLLISFSASLASNAMIMDVDCFNESDQTNFICNSSSSRFKVKNVNQFGLLQDALKLVPSETLLPLKGEEVKMSNLLNRIATHHPHPIQKKWQLPEVSLLSLKHAGVHFIQGHSIDTIIQEARKIRWDDMRELFRYFRYEPSRHTGRYNAISSTVSFEGQDIRNRDQFELQQWALHEVFGVVGIQDTNYKVSTLAVLLIDGQINLKTFLENQYFDLENEYPSLESLSKEISRLNGEGGVTGVEGGGDIVSASIKRHMIMARQWESAFQISRAEVTEIMNYKIQYSSVPVLLKYTEDYKIIDHPHVFTFFHEGEVVAVLKEKFRVDWNALSPTHRIQIAKEIRQYIKEDTIKYKLRQASVEQ
jgi:hypothetical protein